MYTYRSIAKLYVGMVVNFDNTYIYVIVQLLGMIAADFPNVCGMYRASCVVGCGAEASGMAITNER